MAVMFMVLPDRLRCPENIDSHDAVFINLQLHTASICLHRAGVAAAKGENPGTNLLPDVAARLLTAAREIFAVVAVLRDLDALFLNPFVAFAVHMAALVFLDDFVTSYSRQSEECLGALMSLMLVIADRNPMTASLTIQLAQELKRSGVDQSALEKVSVTSSRQHRISSNHLFSPQVGHLISKMDSHMSLPGQQNHATGEVRFCPVQPENVS